MILRAFESLVITGNKVLRARLIALLVIPLTLQVSPVLAITSSWNVDGGGSWSDAGNWNNGVPGTPGDTANLTFDLNTPSIITLPNPNVEFKIGTLNIGDPDGVNGYTLNRTTANISYLSMDALSGNAQIIKANTSLAPAAQDVIGLAGTTNNNSGFYLYDDLDITVDTPATVGTATEGSLAITGPIGADPGKAVAKFGQGTLVLSGASFYSGGFTLNQGKVVVGASSTGAPVTSGPFGTGTITFNGGTITNNTATRTISNPIVVPSGKTVTAYLSAATTDLTFNGPMTGSGTFVDDGTDPSTPFSNATSSNRIFLNGDMSNFTGTVNIKADSHLNQLRMNGTTAGSQNASQTTFVLSSTTTEGLSRLTVGLTAPAGSPRPTFQLGEIHGDAKSRLSFGSNTNELRIDIGGKNTDSDFAGRITELTPYGTLRKVGTGSLTLSSYAGAGGSDYERGTIVSAGTLIAANNAGDGIFTAGGGAFGAPEDPYVTIQVNDDDAGSNNTALLISGPYTISLPVAINNLGTGTSTMGGKTDDNATFSADISLAKSVNVTSVATGGNALNISGAISGVGGVTKVGAGLATLTSGSNSYTGDTKVQQGTLSITNPLLADGADVYLTTGALFNLDFAGTDTIRSLYVNNVPQATGTWGAAGSGAAHISALLSGTTGILSVTTLGTLPGDFNNDGKVNAADYVVWRKTMPGNSAKYNEWRANFGNPPGSGSGLGDAGSVPEPTCGLLLSLAVCAWSVRRRRSF